MFDRHDPITPSRPLQFQPIGAAGAAGAASRPSGGAVDIHCHCLPGVDDGPATMAEALELCQALVDDGIETVIATPHQLGRYDGRNNGRMIRDSVDALTDALEERQISLTVLPGAEVRMDERVPGLVRSGEVVTLADRIYLLLELPPETHLDPLPLIRCLAREGIRTIVAHPERHRPLGRRPEAVRPWVENGAALQVNASSLVGEAGAEAERVAWELLAQPLPLLVATDAHNVKARPPRLSKARAAIEHRLGLETAERVCFANPRNLVGRAAEPQQPAPPVPQVVAQVVPSPMAGAVRPRQFVQQPARQVGWGARV